MNHSIAAALLLLAATLFTTATDAAGFEGGVGAVPAATAPHDTLTNPADSDAIRYLASQYQWN